jgi:hypothetical protein
MIRFDLIQQQAAKFISDNASGILTAGGVVGTVATAVLTARSTYKAAGAMREEMAIRQVATREHAENAGLDPDMAFAADFTKTEVVKLTWKYYIPPVVAGTATCASIIMANHMSARRAAALAAAYGISERRFEEYKEKVAEKFGLNKERDVRDEVAQERVNKNPPDKEVIILAGGDVLCYDMYTGRYFRSTVESIRKAENKINQVLFQHQYASLSEFYQEIGLEPTTVSEEVGWNLLNDRPFAVQFSTTMSPNEEPCIAIDFVDSPSPHYTQIHS